MNIVRTPKEIDDVRKKIDKGLDNGSKYPGMSYEEGAGAMLEWLTNKDAEHPLE